MRLRILVNIICVNLLNLWIIESLRVLCDSVVNL